MPSSSAVLIETVNHETLPTHTTERSQSLGDYLWWHDACTPRAVHITIRTPRSLQLTQAAGCIGTRFRWSPVAGRLHKPSPRICFHLAVAQASALPQFGRARAQHHAKDTAEGQPT